MIQYIQNCMRIDARYHSLWGLLLDVNCPSVCCHHLYINNIINKINSFWPCDAVWRRRTWLTSVPVMASSFQTIIWSNVSWLSGRFYDIDMMILWHEMLMISIFDMSLKIIHDHSRIRQWFNHFRYAIHVDCGTPSPWNLMSDDNQSVVLQFIDHLPTIFRFIVWNYSLVDIWSGTLAYWGILFLTICLASV